MKILLLGVGMQGKAALYDLVHSTAVTEIVAADVDVQALRAFVAHHGFESRVRCESVDATDRSSLERLIGEQPRVVIDLLPRMFIPLVAELAVNHGAHVVNTMYVPPELRAMDARAKAKGVTILPEFGLDPGIDLVMLGDAARSFERIDEIHSYGSGIPELVAADNPLKYKVSWTFEGVLQAYRRPASAIQDGQDVVIDGRDVFAAEHVHHVDVAGLGTLEAYPNGNAIHYAVDAGLNPRQLRAAGRYTMRWPGHCEFWKKLVDLHLLDHEPVTVDGHAVDRVRYLAAALGPHLQYAPGERDLAIVRVDVIGRKDGRQTRVRYELVDRMDLDTGLSGMSRTVGFTASIGAQLLGSGAVTGPGIIAPLNDVPYAALRDGLAQRGVHLTSEETPLDG
ncbi:MAG: saccharopine dehydrogenase C-terminal domain-containing protein [Gemmatimonadaceae bacterium]